MCGISGIVSIKKINDTLVDEVKLISSSLAHRGPDGEGRYRQNNIYLSHRRLSIIDIDGGSQPLYNSDNSVAIIVNGEIYNYIELKEELIKEGFKFKTKSDCEVIVHLYDKYGIDCLQHLRGAFVFALWDNNVKTLFIARDRIGEKPLYYYKNNELIIFSSEISSLIKSKIVPSDLNLSAINNYFYYKYVPEPETVIDKIFKLSTGSFLSVNVDTWEIINKKYWEIEDAPPIYSDPVETIREELHRIGKIIVRSDVPVGVALSGGLDSSIVAALAMQNCKDKVQAFCVGYSGNPSCDERQDASRFAKHLGMPLQEIELRTDNMINFFPELVCKMDEPIGDISGYGYHSIMKSANSNGVKVLLQGQGADELFWGYPWLSKAVRENIEKSSTNSSFQRLVQAFKAEVNFPKFNSFRVFVKWIYDLGGIRNAIQRFKRVNSRDIEQYIFYDISQPFDLINKGITNFLEPSFFEKVNSRKPTDIFRSEKNNIDIDIMITKFIFQTYLVGNGIAQADRYSMSESVESRLPFVDYKLVELVTGLRKVQKDYNLPPKAWLRAAVNDLLPEWVMNRKKRGFTPPVKEWRTSLIRTYGHNLQGGYLQQKGIISEFGAKQLASTPLQSGLKDQLAFQTLILEMWCRQNMTN